MIHTRKQLSRRLNASKRKSIFRSKDKPAGLAVKIAVIFGCCWLIAFLGAAAWYLRKNDSYGRSSSVVGVERLAKRRNEFALLRQQREWKKEKVEEPTEVPGLQTGVKHIPNLQPLSDDPDAYLSPLLIFTCKRQKYLSQTLDDILNNIGSHCAFGCPVIVSEDGEFNHSIWKIKLLLFPSNLRPLVVYWARHAF